MDDIIQCQNLINLLDHPDQPFKFKTKDWVEINDDAQGMYSTNNQFNVKLQC